ncbi:hypothetical protein ABT095_34530 [Kitasatospora sp. NPDC002227]|uniref:hypothetical protein n=1 Tax=Kitasatospora sp. NPDC002227 TaxID=3154773 RepID=UPI0033230E97
MTVPPSSEPTLWELQRGLERMREDQRDAITALRDDLRGELRDLAVRFDQVVTKDVYLADRRVLEQRVSVVERDLAAETHLREETEARAVVQRRWAVGAFVAPLAVAAVQVWLISKGAAP